MSNLWKDVYSKNSGVTDGGRECPPTLLTGKYLLTYLENGDKEKRENGEE